MIGLALSMGASSLLIPRQNEGATAAEPTPTDATTTSAAASPAAPTAQVAEHVVSQGQTLWQLSRQYQVDVNAIAAANALKVGDVLKVGQVVLIPTPNRLEVARPATPKSQLVASADLSQVATEAQPAEKVEVRNASLDRLRQQQEKLRNSLAALRSQEQETKQTAKSEPVTIATQPPQPEVIQPTEQLAVKPGSDSDWLRSNEALTAPTAPELITEAPAARPAAPVARVAQQPPTVVPPVQQVAAKPAGELISYQVSPGDTAAQIAREHNISLSALVQTNRISNPNIIFVGQVLRVPAPAVQAQQRAPQPVEQVAARPSVVPATANLAPQANLGTGGTLPDSRFDPHVQSLLAEIKVLRERHRSTVAAEAPEASTGVTAPQAVTTASLPTMSVGTQFNPGGLNTIQVENRERSQSVPVRVPTAEAARTASQASQPEQIAAAPAGSESYAPLLKPVEGRMVSPDLPPLQGEDNFLPEGSPIFKGYAWPAKGLLTSGYGWRWGRMHAGIDIAADVGTPIFAAADGVVEYSGWNSGGYGNLVEIRHADGSLTRYAHLNTSMVQEGQKVKQGEQIAEMGSTGYSTGPHLHFEVHVAGDGGTVDPVAYLPQQ
jgi:murein DD-endopeptidase MepM/ murein hydrolase activator NlpD